MTRAKYSAAVNSIGIGATALAALVLPEMFAASVCAAYIPTQINEWKRDSSILRYKPLENSMDVHSFIEALQSDNFYKFAYQQMARNSR